MILSVIAILLALGVGVLIGDATQATIKQPVKVELTGQTLSSAATSSRGSGTGSRPESGSPNSCTNGTAGCKNGKQTGNFFGG